MWLNFKFFRKTLKILVTNSSRSNCPLWSLSYSNSSIFLSEKIFEKYFRSKIIFWKYFSMKIIFDVLYVDFFEKTLLKIKKIELNKLRNHFKVSRVELKIMICFVERRFVRKYLLNRSEDAKNGFFRKFYIDLVIPQNCLTFFFRWKK